MRIDGDGRREGAKECTGHENVGILGFIERTHTGLNGECYHVCIIGGIWRLEGKAWKESGKGHRGAVQASDT